MRALPRTKNTWNIEATPTHRSPAPASRGTAAAAGVSMRHSGGSERPGCGSWAGGRAKGTMRERAARLTFRCWLRCGSPPRTHLRLTGQSDAAQPGRRRRWRRCCTRRPAAANCRGGVKPGSNRHIRSPQERGPHRKANATVQPAGPAEDALVIPIVWLHDLVSPDAVDHHERKGGHHARQVL